MDHSYSTATSFQPLPPEVTATGARIVSSLHSGSRAIVLVGAPGSGKTMTLDAVLAGMPAWVERVSNRIPQPLTLARILTQIEAPLGDDPALSLLQTLLDRGSPTEPAVLAVDDAHTLTAEALAALARVPGLGGPDLPGMVLILAGEPELLRRLHGPGMAPLRGPSALTLRMPAPGAVAAASALAAHAGEMAPVVAATRRWPYVAGIVGIATLSAALLMQLPTGGPGPSDPVPAAAAAAGVDDPAQAAPVLAEPVPAQPAAVVVPPEPVPVPAAANSVAETPNPAATPVPPPATEAEADTPRAVKPQVPEAQLRREFDAFLSRAGRDTAGLTPAAREGLFREYLAWKKRAP